MTTNPRDFVCFASAFAYETAPNITHMTLDGQRTACGRTDWATTEGWHKDGPRLPSVPQGLLPIAGSGQGEGAPVTAKKSSGRATFWSIWRMPIAFLAGTLFLLGVQRATGQKAGVRFSEDTTPACGYRLNAKTCEMTCHSLDITHEVVNNDEFYVIRCDESRTGAVTTL